VLVEDVDVDGEGEVVDGSGAAVVMVVGAKVVDVGAAAGSPLVHPAVRKTRATVAKIRRTPVSVGASTLTVAFNRAYHG